MPNERSQEKVGRRPEPEDLASPGGKGDWQRTADAAPSGEKHDPKEHEPRKGDMSEREGPFGDRAPK